MKKLVNEEVGKETMDKTVSLAVKLTNPSIKAFMKALKFTAGKSSKVIGKTVGEKIHLTKGKQSVKTLVRQGQGVSSIR